MRYFFSKCCIVFITSILLASCTKEVDMKINFGKSNIVLNSILTPDSIIKVSLTHSIPVNSTDLISFVENAEVFLFENSILVDTLKYTSNGNYISNRKPKTKSIYTTLVKVNSDTTLIATDTVPEQIPIDSLKLLRKNNSNYTIRFVATDISNENNYFILKVLQINDTVNYTVSIPNCSFFSEISAYELFDKSILIDDFYFSGKQKAVDFICYAPEAIKIKVELLSISRALYYYYLTATQNFYANQGVDFSRVPVFSNVNNKMGILGAYSLANDSILIK